MFSAASECSVLCACSKRAPQQLTLAFHLFQPCCAATGQDHAAQIYRIMKLPVVGGMTQAEGIALGAFVTSGDECLAVPDLNLGIHGVLLDNGAPSSTVGYLLIEIFEIC